jgi:hypothetical protein
LLAQQAPQQFRIVLRRHALDEENGFRIAPTITRRFLFAAPDKISSGAISGLVKASLSKLSVNF